MVEWLGYYRPIKKGVTLRLDADVLAWFQWHGIIDGCWVCKYLHMQL